MSAKYKTLSPVLIKRWGVYMDKWTHAHWCPACCELHDFACDQPFSNGSQWKFSGNVELPSFEPSMNIRIGSGTGARNTTIEVCHYFLRNGLIEFLPDCTHAMAGQTVPMSVIPKKATAYMLESKGL